MRLVIGVNITGARQKSERARKQPYKGFLIIKTNCPLAGHDAAVVKHTHKELKNCAINQTAAWRGPLAFVFVSLQEDQNY